MSSSSPPPDRPPATGRVLYPTGDRSHLPAGVLQSADLTPEMLANNLRAGLFPEKGQRIRNTIEQSLARQAWLEVSAVERLHRRTCPHSKLKHIRSVHSAGEITATASTSSPSAAPVPPSSASSPSDDQQLPVPTRLYARLFQERPFPHLTIFKATPPPSVDSTTSLPNPLSSPPAPSPASSSPATASSTPPAVLDLASPPSPVVYYGPRVLGSEVWTLDRCSVEQSYLVTYFADGDAFYSDVYPVNWSGAYDCLRLRVKRWLDLS